jgi:hypothetical protein
MEIRTANGSRHLEDRIARRFDFGIGDRIAADVTLTVPAERLHDTFRFLCLGVVPMHLGLHAGAHHGCISILPNALIAGGVGFVLFAARVGPS